jgi:hypothetical protein
LEDSDSDDGEVNGAELADIAVDSSDEEGEDSQGAKVASQPSLKWKTEVMEKARGTEDSRWRSCRVAVEEQVSYIGKREIISILI